MHQVLHMADEALTELKDAFLRLDSAQRTARTYVDQYVAVLPQRARTSGLVPRNRALDEATDAHMAAYLLLLDTHPLVPRMEPEAASRALQEFRALHQQLEDAAQAMEQFILDYDVEFQRVGRELDGVQQDKNTALAALRRAVVACQDVRAQGYASHVLEETLEDAREAGRVIEQWRAAQGLDELRRSSSTVTRLASEVEAAALDFPQRVRRAQHRVSALATRAEAISTRAARIPDDLGALRREFSEGNWVDLQSAEAGTVESLRRVDEGLSQLQSALGQGRWDEALVELAELEQILTEADQTVDAPRRRLLDLREFRADPEPAFRRATFAVRDAQMLVTGGPPHAQRPYAEQLDRLRLRLDRVRQSLERVHPDYWSALTWLEGVHDEVRRLVDRYRESRG